VTVPTPRLLDEAGTILGTPCSVLDYVDGAPLVGADADGARSAGRTFAAHLASVHRLDAGAVAAAGIDLPRRADAVDRSLADPPADLDHRLREGAIREVLRRRPPRRYEGPPRLLHGDFWPGNVIWRGDDIVAVIDWEDAALGDPLADVATTRLDLAWGFGPEATAAFTDHYLSLMPVDPTDLPIWDLLAALRPAGSLAAWAADWADFGRPDVTEQAMRAAHTRFVDEALAALDAR
jgi:aminoglycoside phosphotransferase (APT) family kinase protein